MQEVTLNVLNVGQGLCSVVSGIKDNGEPYCGIFDCGTLAYNLKCSKKAALDQIDSLICIGGQKVITDIVISHQDIDHWSLLMDILSSYFEMQKGRLYRKDKFVCEMTEDGTRLFTVSKIFRVIARFEGAAENEGRMQKIDYKIEMDESVRSFHYEGTFSNVGTNWKIAVAVFSDIRTQGEQNIVKVHLICKNYADEEIASAHLTDASDVMAIDGYSELTKQTLKYAAENKLKYDETKFGIMDFKYLQGHFRAVQGFVNKNLYSFSKIVKKVTSVPENASVTPIENLVWGGKEPGIKCRFAQNIMEIMRDHGFIQRFSVYPDGGYVIFKDDQLQYTEAMICANYDSDMIDAHRETIQQLNIIRNVTSTVACMNFADQVRFLFPGDITVHRFVLLVEAVEDENAYMASIMTAPHHGSDVTNFCILQDSIHIQPLYLLLDLFVKDARRIFIVSALSSKFGHPGKCFLDDALDYASDGSEHRVCYGKEILARGITAYEPIIEETMADVFCTEMAQEQYGLRFSYPEPQNAVCSERTQAPRRQCKMPSKRLFL